MQLIHPFTSASKKTKVVSSAGKVAITVFEDAKYIVFIEYFQMGHIINEQCYNIFLRLLRNVITNQTPRKTGEWGLFNQENTLAHKSSVSMAMGVTEGLNWLVTIPILFI